MNIEKVLKEYKVKKAYVDSVLARIEKYKYAIDHPEIYYRDYIAPTKELGMPSGGTGRKGSWVESYVIGKEFNDEKIQKLIANEEARVFFPRMELEQIEEALNCLTIYERQIIEWKYFDSMMWKDITENYNSQFRAETPITYETLKKKNKIALNKLSLVLSQFYEDFNQISEMQSAVH